MRRSYECPPQMGAAFFWRHEASAQILQRSEPEIVIAEQVLRGLELIKGDFAFVHAIAVAIPAILGKNGFDFLVEPRGAFARDRPKAAWSGHDERKRASEQ